MPKIFHKLTLIIVVVNDYKIKCDETSHSDMFGLDSAVGLVHLGEL